MPVVACTKLVDCIFITRNYLREDCDLLPVEEMPHKLRISFFECSEEMDSLDLLQDTLVRSGVPMKNVMKLL
jgi:hypothetical protein